MSATPKWMPSEEDFIAAIDADSYLPGTVDFPNTETVIRRTGLSDQIAVLEEEDVHMATYKGRYTYQNKKWRQDKIAALRKELGE